MKVFFLVLACALALLLAFAGCNYIEPVRYIDVANHSGQSVENLAVQYPKGDSSAQFGLPQLGNGQSYRRMTDAGWPCKFTVELDDVRGKHYVSNFDLGAKCPKEIAFEIGAGMKVSQRTVKP